MSEMVKREVAVADVGISGPVDGMGTPDKSGSYLRLTITTQDDKQKYRISIGAAEILAAEILGALGSPA